MDDVLIIIYRSRIKLKDVSLYVQYRLIKWRVWMGLTDNWQMAKILTDN